jgi:hypothetical protein
MIHEQVPELPECSREVQFHGQYFIADASKLKQDSLYYSKSVNMNVGEFLTVNHTTKTVTFYQSNSKDLKNHGFKLKTLDKVAKGLSMRNGES